MPVILFPEKENLTLHKLQLLNKFFGKFSPFPNNVFSS